MRRIIAVITIIIYMLVLQSCTAQNNHDTNLSNYGVWEETTTNILYEDFNNILPERETVSVYGQKYYYKSSQGTFGDKNFVICVVLCFLDETSYEEELSKCTSLLSSPVLQDDTAYYPIQYSHEAAAEYADDKIYDGMFYNFEIVSANKKDYTICYISAHVWDYYKDQVLIDYLQLISDIPYSER